MLCIVVSVCKHCIVIALVKVYIYIFPGKHFMSVISSVKNCMLSYFTNKILHALVFQ